MLLGNIKILYLCVQIFWNAVSLTSLSSFYRQHQPDETSQGVNQGKVKTPLIHNHTHLHCLKKGKCFQSFSNGRILPCWFVFPLLARHFFLPVFSPWHHVSELLYLLPINSLWHWWNLKADLVVTALSELLAVSRSLYFSCLNYNSSILRGTSSRNLPFWAFYDPQSLCSTTAVKEDKSDVPTIRNY